MKEKVKFILLSVFRAISFAFKYLFTLIRPSIRNIGVIIICSLAVYGFYDTAAPLAMKGLYDFAIKGFYILMVAVCVVNAVITTYKTAERQLVSPKDKADYFRYFNGFLIGVITAAPFIAMCISANAGGFTYYDSDYIVELEKFFLYVYAFWFSEYPTAADFSYLQFMLLALVPVIACTLSYIAPKIAGGIKSRKSIREEAV